LIDPPLSTRRHVEPTEVAPKLYPAVGRYAVVTHSTPSAVDNVRSVYDAAYARSRMCHLRVLNVNVDSRVQPCKFVIVAADPVCDTNAMIRSPV
jgi:hypothetical protein